MKQMKNGLVAFTPVNKINIQISYGNLVKNACKKITDIINCKIV